VAPAVVRWETNFPIDCFTGGLAHPGGSFVAMAKNVSSRRRKSGILTQPKLEHRGSLADAGETELTDSINVAGGSTRTLGPCHLPGDPCGRQLQGATNVCQVAE
jgi:hypothetical protein